MLVKEVQSRQAAERTSSREPHANLYINGTWDILLTSVGLLSMSPEASLLETFLQTPTHVN